MQSSNKEDYGKRLKSLFPAVSLPYAMFVSLFTRIDPSHARLPERAPHTHVPGNTTPLFESLSSFPSPIRGGPWLGIQSHPKCGHSRLSSFASCSTPLASAYVLATQVHLLLPSRLPSCPQLQVWLRLFLPCWTALICVPLIPSFGPAPLSGTSLDPAIKMHLHLLHIPSRLSVWAQSSFFPI